ARRAGEPLLQLDDPQALLGDAGLGGLVRLQDRARELLAHLSGELPEEAPRILARGVDRAAEAEPELPAVLEGRVRPRGPAAVRVRRVRRRREIPSVDRGAAGRVRDERAVAEELRDELDVGRLAAARARPRVLEEGLEELRGLHVVQLQGRAV